MPLPDFTTFPILTTDNLATESRSGMSPALSGEIAPFNMTGLTIPPPSLGTYATPKTTAVVSELGLRRAIRRHYDGSVNGYNLGTGTGKPFRDSSNKIFKTRSIKSLSDKISVYEESGRLNIFYDNTSFSDNVGSVQGGVYQMWGANLFGVGSRTGFILSDNYIETRFTDPAETDLGYEFDVVIAKICIRIPNNKAFPEATIGNESRIYLGTDDNFGRFGYFLTRDSTYIQNNGEWVPFMANSFYGRRQYEYFTVPEGGSYPTWKIYAALDDGTTIDFDPGSTGVPTKSFEVYIFYDMVRYS